MSILEHFAVNACLFTVPKFVTTSSDEDIDVLEKRIGELNEELLDITSLSAIRTSLLQSLQLGQATLHALFPAGGELSPLEDNRRIKSLVNNTVELVSKVLRIHQEMNELQRTLNDFKAENAKSMKNLRELMISHDKLVCDQQKTSDRCHKDQRFTRAHETYNHLTDKLELLQNCFQGLVLGSGVNWNDSTELRTIVLELGQSVEDIVN